MSKTKLFNLLTLGAISLGLVACEPAQPVEHPEQDIQVQEVREETAENEEAVDTEETLPETEEQEAHEEGQLYTVIQDDDNATVYQLNGSVKLFVASIKTEAMLAEQGSEDLPLMQLIIGTAMASALQPDKEFTLITKGGDVLFTYKGGEPVKGILLELE